ncbi:hypothetical protein HDU87_001135 [Geranomyces variabilis]|uniref:Uncharacterized protein n=1 Tax=Geranomyces variabilis TaxID=109894 RepID=A0AAD5TSZ2_9FUNG|nr:hypothetical protein HDU87_001135 [Geranomyces variabilis]
MSGNRFAALADDYAPPLPAIVTKPTATLKRVVSSKQADDPVFPAEFLTRGLPERFQSTVYHSKTLDPSVTRRMFLRWRLPQVCIDNPTDVTNPYYIALIKAGWCGYSVSKHFIGDRFVDGVGPVWCFCRYGRSRTVLDRPVSSLAGTVLEAGTKIFIAGQHEDGSDPDFFIYNDVTVVFPNGDIKIHQYPHEVFPPTDGHSATLLGNHVWLIGSVGYRGARGKKAQVCVLDLT